MRKRIKNYCLCSSSPKGQLNHLSSRQLSELVEWGMKAVECSRGGSVRAKRGLELGKMCEESGHPVLALQVWLDTLSMVECDNWDWEEEPINTRLYSFDSKVAYAETEELAKNIDRLWRMMGHNELAHCQEQAHEDYRSLWLYKYQEPYWDR